MEEIREQSAPRTQSKRMRWFARGGLVIVSAFTAWHIFASFLWISPPSQLRTVVPGNLLSSYMLPWFGQSWSVFAPEPINGDYKLKVRAVLSDGFNDSDNEVTEWVDATAVELSWSQYNLFPPRAMSLSNNQASKLLAAWKALNEDQKEVTALGYFKGDDWLRRMQLELQDHGDNKDKIVEYIVQERYTTAYATQVAYAIWGEENVAQVQFEVSRQNVVPFAQRNNPDAERPAPQIANTGWRGTLLIEGQSTSAFSDAFAKGYRELNND